LVSSTTRAEHHLIASTASTARGCLVDLVGRVLMTGRALGGARVDAVDYLSHVGILPMGDLNE
jgi:hypothetical protein